MKRLFKIVAAAVLLAAPSFAASAIVTDAGGEAEYSRDSVWAPLTKGLYLQENDSVKTGPSGKASLVLDTGSQIDIGPSTKVQIAKLTDTDTLLDMAMGELTNKVEKLKEENVSFAVKTPASVCAVRGTKFSVIVDKSGKTRVNVFAGVVSAREISGIGEEIYIRQNQFLEILPGVAPEQAADMSFAPTAREVIMAKAEFLNEVRMDMTKEQVQAAAATEIKNAEYEQGKTMMDYFGKRVRIEEYIVRPQSDQFKFVALNERDSRFDYFTWLATFNTDLPADLSVANQIAFNEPLTGWDSKPSYWIEQHDCAVSNTVDKVEWTKKRDNWDTAASVTDFKLNNQVVGAGAYKKDDILDPSGDHRYDYILYADPGITLDGSGQYAYREDYYMIDDEGKMPSTKAEYDSNPDGYNQEMVFTSDAFSGPGGKIDLVIAPEIFEQAGMR